MAKNFAIVKYTDEDDALGIVPINWISDDEDSCYFPTVKSNETRDKLIRNQAEPEEQWVLCPIKILHKYETYSQARLNLKKAEETSNLDTDDDDVPNTRKKNSQYIYPGESDEDEAGDIIEKNKEQKKVPEYPNLSCFRANKEITIMDSSTSKINSTALRTESPTRSTNSSFTTRKNISAATRQTESPTTSTSSRSTNLSLSDADRILFGQMQATIAAMADQIATLNDKVDILLTNQQSSILQGANPEFALIGHLPLQNMDDFDAFEEKAKSDDNFANQFVKILASIGGRDMKTSVNNMMRRIMSDLLAEQFSYSGKMKNEIQKIAFCKKKICNAIHVAARKMFREEATDEKIRGVVCIWLQQAKTRRNRRDQRNQSQE